MKKATFRESSYPSCINYYELNLMKGCGIGCIYCGLLEPGQPEVLDISDILKGPIPLRGIYMSPDTDAFQDSIKESAHKVLERFLPEEVPFLLITKKQIPEKTIELLAKYRHLVVPHISLARLGKRINNYVEPEAASTEERLETMKNLADAGLNVTALLMPAYPGVDDTSEKLNPLIEAYAKSGAKFVKAAYAVINKKDIEIIKKMTESVEVPELRNSWDKMTEEIEVQIGRGNVLSENKRIEFYRTLNDLCKQYGLKFLACSVLDPSALKYRSKEIPVCRNVRIVNPLSK